MESWHHTAIPDITNFNSTQLIHFWAKFNMTAIREELIQLAITEVQEGVCSQKDAAEKYSIPQSTLNRRLHGAHPRQQAKIHEQRLSPVQERHVVDWCLNEEKSG